MFDSIGNTKLDNLFSNILIVLLIIGILVFVPWLMIYYSNNYNADPNPKQAVIDAGYSDVHLGRTNLYFCPGDGERGTEFTATSKATGHIVEGVVCYTSLGGHQVRIK